MGPPDRAWTLNFHAAAVPSSINVNGTRVDAVASASALNTVLLGWFYDSNAHRLMVRLQDSPVPLQITISH
ncbi:MAG TPA: hypothetical protein VEK84_15150 [Terriglobales bacterium]|nr:hypothetical protein [Terriglobales bacterium]